MNAYIRNENIPFNEPTTETQNSHY